MESGDSYQIRAERILITILCPFWAPDSKFGHRVPNWAPNRPIQIFRANVMITVVPFETCVAPLKPHNFVNLNLVVSSNLKRLRKDSKYR